jgi:hypothetical protein
VDNGDRERGPDATVIEQAGAGSGEEGAPKPDRWEE